MRVDELAFWAAKLEPWATEVAKKAVETVCNNAPGKFRPPWAEFNAALSRESARQKLVAEEQAAKHALANPQNKPASLGYIRRSRKYLGQIMAGGMTARQAISRLHQEFPAEGKLAREGNGEAFYTTL